MAFLPTTKKEIEQLGWDVPDFVLVTGDAYVDHPTFGVATVSYTHLDVYKRQVTACPKLPAPRIIALYEFCIPIILPISVRS